MSIPVLIIGKSGTGKSTSLRNLNPDDCFLVQTIKKPLPFKSYKWQKWNAERNEGSVIHTDDAKKMIHVIKMAKSKSRNIVIIDDFQYQMSNTFMRKAFEKGYDKFTGIARDAWDICQAAIDEDSDIRIYILSHTQEDEYGENIKMKTIGKMLDDKITMEGMFSIVLRSAIDDGHYKFLTKNNGHDTVKTPMGLFESGECDNDLNMIDEKICDYYHLVSTDILEKEINQLLDNESDEYKKIVLSYVQKNKDNPSKLRSTINKIKAKQGEE